VNLVQYVTEDRETAVSPADAMGRTVASLARLAHPHRD